VLGVPFTGYACAKAAVCRFTDQLTAELWDTSIRINCIEPGMVWDDDHRRQIAEEEARTGTQHPLRPQNHSPEEAAELALWLVSAQSGELRGRCVSVNDRWWKDPEKAREVDGSLRLYRVWRHALDD
jgi:3-oxoacyl-[acyl-carrier protein] reductase